MGRVAGLLVLCLLLAVTACARDSGAGTTAATSAPSAPAGRQGAVLVRFETATGAAVSGLLFGQPSPNGVVLAGQPGSAPAEGVARELAALGLMVLVVDLPPASVVAVQGTLPAVAAIRAAAGYLRSRGAGKVVMVGERDAGAAALQAAAGDKISGVAVLSASPAYRTVDAAIDSVAAIARIDRTVLLMAALGDPDGAPAARRLYDAARDPRTLALIPGQGRGLDLVQGQAGTEAFAVLRDFLREAFAPLSA